MLDNFERRPNMGNYWSALINPALLNFNDFSNFYVYHRNLVAMQHHLQQQELLRQHYGNCCATKKRPQQKSEAECSKPKRPKIEQKVRTIAGPLIVGDNPEDLRAETTTPNSNRSGLITFRPHSDILTSSMETRGGCSKTHLQRKKVENADAKKVEYDCAAMLPSLISNTSRSTSCSSEFEDGNGPVTRLFPEILSMIFEYLDLPAKGRAAQVCSTWRDAVYKKSVWKGIEAKLHLKRSNQTLFSSLVRRGIKKVQVLSLRRSLRELMHGMPNLESLNLSGCYNLSESAIESAFTRSMPKLKELNVSLCKEISDNSLSKIATNCKGLQTLDLGGCSKVTNNGILYISWDLKNLKRLNLRSCRQITDQGIVTLCGLNESAPLNPGAKNLEELCLQDCQKLTDKALKYISANLPKLYKLNLSFCVSITDTGLKYLAKSPRLQDLNLCSCDNVSDIGIGFLARANDCQDSNGTSNRLERLDVSFCSNITDSGMKHIATGLTHLKYLSVANCSLTDESLIKIAKSLLRLETLNIGQCGKVSDVGMEEVAKNLLYLNQIDLYGCSKVTEKALLLLKKMPNLARINQKLWPDQ